MATFRQLKSGKWQARVSRDGQEFSIGTFPTKKQAQIEASKVEERIYYGLSLNDRNLLFEEVAITWLEHKRNNVKDQTYVQLESVLRLHIMPFFERKRMMRISRADISKWMQTYADYKNNDGSPKYKHGTRTKHLSVLKDIFYYATHEMEVLEKDPTRRLTAPIQDNLGKDDEIKYFSLEELNQLLDYMETYEHQRFKEYRLYYMLMYFMSQSGLRISEALALRWSDLKGNRLTIERQTVRDDNNKVQIGTLKTKSSYRKIQLEQEVLDELERFRETQEKMIEEYEGFTRSKDGIIFQNFKGGYLTPSIVRESIQEYCELAGVEYKGTHGFRHTHAVLLLEAGLSLKAISKRLGHSTIRTTADTYLDVTKKIEEDELEKFASYTSRKI